MLDIFDRVANWVSESPEPNDRYLWILNHQTTEITWKNRKVYSFWQSKETGNLQEIFREMTSQLPYGLQASTQDEFQNLVDLRHRITKSYEGFLKAHDSFFGMIYQYFFAYELTDNYEELMSKLNKIISASFSKQDISSLSPKEIEEAAKFLENNRPYPPLDIDWATLSFEQFQAACKMERYSKPITLDSLDQEKTTYLLERDPRRISQFSHDEIQQNLDKIELRFLCHLSGTTISKLDLSDLSTDDLAELLINVNFYAHELHFVDLSVFSSEQITAILKKKPSILGDLPPKTVADNLSKINIKYFSNLTYTQISALDFSQLTGDQFMNLPGSAFVYDDKKMHALNLTNFTTDSISKLLKNPFTLRKLSPSTVAANLTRIETSHYNDLTHEQLQAIDYNQLKDFQKKVFTTYHLQQMKNYPKPQYGAKWEDDFFNSFFGNFFGAGNQYSYKSFSGFGFRLDDEWESQYFKSTGGSRTQASQNDKIKSYQVNLTSAINKIKALNKQHPEPLYEKLRLKCLKKGKELADNPKLIFVDNAKDFEQDKLKQYYMKMSLIFHPDKNQDNLEEATELFKVVNEAYKYLLP